MDIISMFTRRQLTPKKGAEASTINKWANAAKKYRYH
jgi:hypothetical protein